MPDLAAYSGLFGVSFRAVSILPAHAEIGQAGLICAETNRLPSRSSSPAWETHWAQPSTDSSRMTFCSQLARLYAATACVSVAEWLFLRKPCLRALHGINQ